MSYEASLYLLVILGVLLVGLAAGYWFVVRQPSGKGDALRMHKFSENDQEGDEQDSSVSEDSLEEEQQEAARVKKPSRPRDPTIDEQLFMAGKLSGRERAEYYRIRMLAPIVCAAVGGVVGIVLGSLKGALLMMLLGVVLGAYVPIVMLRKWVERHHEELSYTVPLFIEQVAIGVSSSLDIGPCLTRIVEMADDRNSHNASTLLLKYALFYVKSGVSLEEALIEIGKASRHPEFKHALLALSQVAKFGGEISKQLQELADSAAAQREAKVEARIRQLELKASGPVALVFVSYMALLGLGIAAQIFKTAPQ